MDELFYWKKWIKFWHSSRWFAVIFPLNYRNVTDNTRMAKRFVKVRRVRQVLRTMTPFLTCENIKWPLGVTLYNTSQYIFIKCFLEHKWMSHYFYQVLSFSHKTRSPRVQPWPARACAPYRDLLAELAQHTAPKTTSQKRSSCSPAVTQETSWSSQVWSGCIIEILCVCRWSNCQTRKL